MIVYLACPDLARWDFANRTLVAHDLRHRTRGPRSAAVISTTRWKCFSQRQIVGPPTPLKTASLQYFN
jgi:hypothetical protein